MRCERCGTDTQTSRYEVDGFHGQLCEACAEMWDEIQN